MHYQLLIGTGFLTGTFVFVWMVRQSGLAMGPHLAGNFVVAVSAVFGAGLWSCLETSTGGFPMGLRYPGAAIAILCALVVLRDRRFGISLPHFADALAVSIPFGFATMRIGCFFQGCCFGGLCDLPWAVVFPRDTTAWQVHRLEGAVLGDSVASLPVHPLQIYFAVWALAVGLFLLWFRKHQSFPGQLGLLYLALHEPGKFLLEFMRYQYAPAVQLVSMLLAVSGATALAFISRRASSDPAPAFPILPKNQSRSLGDARH